MGGLLLRDVLGTSPDFSERMSQVASTGISPSHAASGMTSDLSADV